MTSAQAAIHPGSTSATIRQIRAADLKHVISELIDVFVDTVNNGSSLGFLPPISRETARDYWISLLPELHPGSRILLVATNHEGRVVGSGQLIFSQRQNASHRAELQKLFVAREARRHGVGELLVEALHHVARQHGRTLITLNTLHKGPAQDFYTLLGYKEAGVVPGWALGPNGEKYDDLTMYLHLE
jgi:GNAT superfamily N-acetyltransferase